MCMEDVKIGRNISSECRTVLLPSNTLTRICGPNDNRVSLTIGSGFLGSIVFGPATLTLSALSGFANNTNFPPVTLRIEDIGNMITQEWFAFSAGLNQHVTIIDASLPAKSPGELR